jgi:hypothetical protein
MGRKNSAYRSGCPKSTLFSAISFLEIPEPLPRSEPLPVRLRPPFRRKKRYDTDPFVLTLLRTQSESVDRLEFLQQADGTVKVWIRRKARPGKVLAFLPYPLPCPAAVRQGDGLSLAVFCEAVEDCRDGRSWIPVTGKHYRIFLTNLITYLAGTHRPLVFHQDHAARPCKTSVSTSRLSTRDQFLKFGAQYVRAKKIGEPGNGLLEGSDPFDQFGTLLQQAAEFLVGLPHHLLHMIFASVIHGSGETVAGVHIFWKHFTLNGFCHWTSPGRRIEHRIESVVVASRDSSDWLRRTYGPSAS